MYKGAYNIPVSPAAGSDGRTLRDLPDEQLCAVCGESSQALEELVRRHQQLVRQCARSFFLTGADSDDLLQEGMLGLLHAAALYDPARDASFRTFAAVCIRRRLVSAVRAAGAQRHRPLNESVPLGTFSSDASPDEAHFPSTEQSPEELLIDKEEFLEFRRRVAEALSPLERRVLELYLEGLSYGEIGRSLRKSPKAVDNAVQRVRRKLARLQPQASTA